MGEGYGEDNRKGACKARRDHQVKDDGTGEAENRFAHRRKKEVVTTPWPGSSRPRHIR
jgi:hypothetical protein